MQVDALPLSYSLFLLNHNHSQNWSGSGSENITRPASFHHRKDLSRRTYGVLCCPGNLVLSNETERENFILPTGYLSLNIVID